MKKFIIDIHKDHLYRNSVYLMLNSIISAGFGFVFWIICARLFTTEQVGYATTIISAIGLVSSFSFLGLNTALIRYLPKAKDKERLIGSCLNLTGLVAIIAALIFLALVPFLSPKLMFVLESKTLFAMFIIYTLFWVLFTEIDSIFIASRKSGFVLVKTTIFSISKLILPIVLVFLGTFGILGAYYISSLIGCIFSFFYFRYKFVIDLGLIKEMFMFSIGNYAAGIFIMMPGLILPIMITNIIGPESTAYFYVAFMITSLLLIIPGAVGQSLLTEGSHDSNNLNKKIKKAYLFDYSLLLPATAVIVISGKFLLSLFSADYVQAYPLLIFFSISGFFLVINTIYGTVWNIKKLVRYVIAQNFIKAFCIITLALIFLPSSSIIVVSQIWLGSEVLAAIFSILRGFGT